MLIRRAVGSGVVVVRSRLHGRGSVALRCASGARSAARKRSAQRGVQRITQRSSQRSAQRSGARCACLSVFLRGTRVLVGAGVECASPLSLQHCGFAALQAAAAGAQLYFPREDVSFLFVDTLRSIGRWVLSTHACLLFSRSPAHVRDTNGRSSLARISQAQGSF